MTCMLSLFLRWKLLTFSDKLKELRKSHNITQVQAAAAFGLTERQYQRLEAGDSLPMFENLITIADFYKISLDELVCRTAPKD